MVQEGEGRGALSLVERQACEGLTYMATLGGTK